MEKPSPGRPRHPESDKAILEATLKLIASEGYGRMSMDRIAAEAGVSKPTIYRRYDSKEDLAIAALAYLRVEHAPRDGIDTRTELVKQMRHFRHSFDELGGMPILGTVLVEERRTPKLFELWAERISKPYRKILREILEHAQSRGEIDDKADLDITVDMLLGGYYAHYFSKEPFPDNWPEPLVEAILRSLKKSGEQE